MRVLFAGGLLAAVLLLPPVARADQATLTTGQAVDLRAALLSLDFYEKMDAGGKVAKVPYKLSGPVRMTIARDLAVLDPIEKFLQKTRMGLIAQLASGGNEVPKDKMGEFAAQMQEALNTPQQLPLGRIKQDDLGLDGDGGNQIPASVLAALLPILGDAPK